MFSRQRVGVVLVSLFIVGTTLPAAPPADKSEEKPQQPESRTWTDITGKFKVDAAFVESKDGRVRLKKESGSVIDVPLEKLSKEDRDYVTNTTNPGSKQTVKQMPVGKGERLGSIEGEGKDKVAEEQPTKQGPIIVQLAFEAVVQTDRHVFIKGKTNLPPRTVLMVDVVEADPNGFFGQGKCEVLTDGSFQAEARPCGQNTDLIKKGTYVATVTMPFARMQPAEVQGVIGAKGEKLRGPIVKHDELKGATNDELEGAFLQVKKRVQVP